MPQDEPFLIQDDAGVTWLVEPHHEIRYHFRVDRVLRHFETRYAAGAIVDTPAFGRILSLEGSVQSAAEDEADYHEALVAPAFALAARPPRRVAILGGGEGATLREVLRFPSVEHCVMVDIDGELVALCRELLPTWSAGAFDDPRAEVVVGDALAWLHDPARDGAPFDLIIGDLPDPEEEGPLRRMYALPTYRRIRQLLAPDGLFITQASEDDRASDTRQAAHILATARAAFDGRAWVYSSFINSFYSEWCWVVAGAELEPPDAVSPDVIDARLAARRSTEHPLETYDGLTHRHLTSLRRSLRAGLANGRVILDEA